MKKLSKVLLALMASAAAVFVVSSFVSCSDDSDDDGAGTVAVYKDTEDGTETVTFYSDKTFKVHVNGEESEAGFKMVFDFDAMTGTYTGAPESDGDVVLTIAKAVNEDAMSESAIMQKVMTAAQAGKTSVTFTNADYPLENVENAEPVTLTVANGLVTFDGTEYKRQ